MVTGRVPVAAQGQQGAQPRATSPRESSVVDLTGNWVSVVTEDWRWRMVTPPKGDYAAVPMTAAARKIADAWDPAQDGSCLAYGAAGLLRMPTRLRVSWESDSVLRIETDAGVQTRRLVFDQAPPQGPRSLQGFSAATWERTSGTEGGSLKVITTNMSGGWVRKNGVPYSENAVMTEYFDRFTAPTGDVWFTVTTILEDAKSFTQPFVTTTHFKREADGAKWKPSPCRSAA